MDKSFPDDWLEKCQKCFFRFVYTASKENIHQSMIVNADQTGIVLVPGGDDPTYEPKGSKQVLIHGKDEKRAFTCVTSVTGTAQVLATQSVWKGKTQQSRPTLESLHTAYNLGHSFTSNPNKHWSSFDTTKEWIQDILLPYRERMIAKYSLDKKAKMILYLDF